MKAWTGGGCDFRQERRNAPAPQSPSSSSIHTCRSVIWVVSRPRAWSPPLLPPKKMLSRVKMEVAYVSQETFNFILPGIYPFERRDLWEKTYYKWNWRRECRLTRWETNSNSHLFQKQRKGGRTIQMIKFQIPWNIVCIVALYSMSLTGVWWRWNPGTQYRKGKTRETARDGWKCFGEIVLQCIHRRHHLLLAGVWIGIRKRGSDGADGGSEESKWRRRRGNGAEIDGIHLPLLYYWTSVRERELKDCFWFHQHPGRKNVFKVNCCRERERENCI